MGYVAGVDASTPGGWAQLPTSVRIVGGYLGAPGHTPHIWTVAEWAEVAVGKRSPLPIWTPSLELTEDPGQSAIAACEAAAVYFQLNSAIVLDTEAVERTLANLVPWVNTWVATVRNRSFRPVVYSGGLYVPTNVTAWFPQGAPLRTGETPAPGCGLQLGQATYGGVTWDLDAFDESFPAAWFIGSGPVVPGPPEPAPDPVPVPPEPVPVPEAGIWPGPQIGDPDVIVVQVTDQADAIYAVGPGLQEHLTPAQADATGAAGWKAEKVTTAQLSILVSLFNQTAVTPAPLARPTT